MMKVKNKKKVEESVELDSFDSLVSSTNNSYADLIDPEDYETDTYVDTGSYVLNAYQSGSIYGGFPGSQITVLAGEKATGKSYILLKAFKLFVKKDPRARAIIWETEFATHESDLIKRGIDPNVVKLLRVSTVEKLHKEIDKVVSGYLKLPKNKRYPLILGVDSIGMLSTDKEIEDLAKGEDKVDMGNKSKLIKKIFRTLSIPLGIAGIPLIATNHVYKEQGAPNPKYAKRKMTGGEGVYYTATSILFLSKSQDKEGDDKVGILITCKNEKCRKALEGTVTQLKLSYKNGLDRYYGLLDIAVEAGLVKRLDSKYKIGDYGLMYASQIYKDPKKYFTKELLDQIDKACGEMFKYGDDKDESLQDDSEEE